MCGRTCLTLNKEQLRCACSYKNGNQELSKPEWLPEHNDGKEFVPSYNIAPSDITPVLLSSARFNNLTQSKRILKPMMWGIIPPWHKTDYKTHGLTTNNCRIENISTSKLYNPILRNGGRCIIIAEGFYEWQTTTKSKVKQPYYLYSPQRDIDVDESESIDKEETKWKGIKLLYIAGLYNVWQDNGTIIYTYTIITMESNDTMNWLHHRMPTILDTEEQIQAWIDIENVNPDMALEFLKPSKKLLWHPVSTAVNNSRNKSMECNKRIDLKKTCSQKTLTVWLANPGKRKQSNTEDRPNKKNKN